MKTTGAQIAARALRDAGVQLILGIPGTHNIELYDALRDEQELQLVLVNSEHSASFMADGYARVGGRVACVNVVPGAGVTHCLSGVAEAFLDQVPMLILTTGIRSDTGARFQLHDIDQCELLRPVTKGVLKARHHSDIYRCLVKAVDLAYASPPGPVAVEIPANLLLFPAPVNEAQFQWHREPPAQLDSATRDQLEVATQWLNQADRVSLYLGLGCLSVTDQLIPLAERLGAAVFTTISGKGIFPEDHPQFAWNVPGQGSPSELQQVWNESEIVLTIGARFSEVATASYGVAIPGRLIHLDVDPEVLSANLPADLAIATDSALAVPFLLERLKPKPVSRSSTAQRLQQIHHQIHAEARRQPLQDQRVTPVHFFDRMRENFPGSPCFVTDSGNGTFLAMEHLRLTEPRRFLAPVDFSCMGYSVPAAIGAALAKPDCPIIALVGDGAFNMTGLELLTAQREKLATAFFILCDRELSQIAQFQRRVLHRTTLTALPPLNYQALASSLGVAYCHLQNDHQIKSGFDQVLSSLQAHQPILVEVNIDYSRQTHFTQGAIKTNFQRLDIKDKFRLASRLVSRKLFDRG